MSDKTALTYGQKMVGLNLYKSEDHRVNEVRQKCAELIDLLHEYQTAEFPFNNKTRSEMAHEAIKQIMTAQMWVVKTITWKE